MSQAEVTNTTSFLQEVETFLKTNGKITASRLGRDVMHDPNFVTELRTGRMVRDPTIQKVRRYIKEKVVVD
jgi:hypothetical protein